MAWIERFEAEVAECGVNLIAIVVDLDVAEHSRLLR